MLHRKNGKDLFQEHERPQGRRPAATEAQKRWRAKGGQLNEMILREYLEWAHPDDTGEAGAKDGGKTAPPVL